MDLEEKYQVKRKMPWRDIEEEIVVVNLQRQHVFNFTEVGRDIWLLLDGNRTLREVVEQITREYDIDFETAAQDVNDFITLLRDRGLIHVPLPSD